MNRAQKFKRLDAVDERNQERKNQRGSQQRGQLAAGKMEARKKAVNGKHTQST